MHCDDSTTIKTSSSLRSSDPSDDLNHHDHVLIGSSQPKHADRVDNKSLEPPHRRISKSMLGSSSNIDMTTDTNCPSMWAISYDQLMDVAVKAKKLFGYRYKKITMRDINDRIIKPCCEEHGTSYALHLNPNGLKIEAFVTHCWDEKFDTFIKSISHFGVTKPNLWICAFALQQGDYSTIAAQVDVPIEESPFVKALEHAKILIVVRNFITDLYGRIWCVCELMFAMEYGLYPHRTYVTGPNKFSNEDSSVLDAKASDPKDKERILKVLLSGDYDRAEIDDIVKEFRTQNMPGPNINMNIDESDDNFAHLQNEIERLNREREKKEEDIQKNKRRLCVFGIIIGLLLVVIVVLIIPFTLSSPTQEPSPTQGPTGSPSGLPTTNPSTTYPPSGWGESCRRKYDDCLRNAGDIDE